MHELPVDDIESQSFSKVRRGYAQDEVDSYLHSLAEEIRAYQAESAERLYQNLGEEMGGLLQHARDSADAMLKEAEEHAAATRHKGEQDGNETRAEAQRQADEIRASAEADAAERIKAADDKVRHLERIETEARSRLVALRAEVESVVTQLATLDATQASDAQLPDEEAATKESLEVRLEDDAETLTASSDQSIR
jgi:DivIVA domain-containing protein